MVVKATAVPTRSRQVTAALPQASAQLFVRLDRPDVPPTNNVSERALRPSVIHRKVTGGFRSTGGPDAYAALASVIDTAALNGDQPLTPFKP